jgi:hypothetical protein
VRTDTAEAKPDANGFYPTAIDNVAFTAVALLVLPFPLRIDTNKKTGAIAE